MAPLYHPHTHSPSERVPSQPAPLECSSFCGLCSFRLPHLPFCRQAHLPLVSPLLSSTFLLQYEETAWPGETSHQGEREAGQLRGILDPINCGGDSAST